MQTRHGGKLEIMHFFQCRRIRNILIYVIVSLDIFHAHFSLLPSTYQYSALTQYDNDRDEEINDLEDHLDILVEDSSSSDNEEDLSTKDILDINAVS